AELKRLQLWSTFPPDARALESTLPFCCDTLPLEQWLQFIFLPRMQALVDARLSLPGKIGILPIAEEAFKSHGERGESLLRLIAVDKPSGMLVHRSFLDKHETVFVMQTLRDQIGQHVFPVHRLDRPTSGVLLFALSADVARLLGQQQEQQRWCKYYLAVVRGF